MLLYKKTVFSRSIQIFAFVSALSPHQLLKGPSADWKLSRISWAQQWQMTDFLRMQ